MSTVSARLALTLSGALLAVLTMPVIYLAQGDPLERARALHRQSPMIDTHNDYPWVVREKGARDLAKLDMRQPQPSIMTDIPRLRAGGVGGQFWSVYVPASLQGQSAVTATMEQIDIVHQMLKRYPDVFEQASTADDIERIFKSGKIASLMGMEGGHSIDSSLGALRMFHGLGVRYMTLTHGRNVPWADSATDKPQHGGLTPFGEGVVGEMNWLGMLVDLSHVSPDSMEDALRVSTAPVIFSHSSARAICNHPRNVPDNVLQLLAKNGGVVQVTFVPDFISQAVADHSKLEEAEAARIQTQFPNDEAARKSGLDAWRQSHAAPHATLSQVADHIDHIRKIAGIDHIGLGADYDGITTVVDGLEDVSKYPYLTAELLRRGYTDQDLKKIMGLNLLRAMRAAEQESKRLQTARPASTAVFTTSAP